MADGPALRRDRFGIERRNQKPRGWRTATSEPVRYTDNAVQVEYYRWLLWLPISGCVRSPDGIHAPLRLIEYAKDHDTAERS
jgi:hypothetical protein